MKNFSTLLFAGLVASSMLSAPAFAQTWVNESIDPGHPRINEVDTRIDNQEQRVQHEEATGQITAGQAARDDRHLDHIQNVENRDAARNGGHLTRGEQHNLNHRLNRDNRRIHHQRVSDGHHGPSTGGHGTSTGHGGTVMRHKP